LTKVIESRIKAGGRKKRAAKPVRAKSTKKTAKKRVRKS